MVLPLAGCAPDERPAAAPSSSAAAASPPREHPAMAQAASRFATLERKHDARLGVYALATRTGAVLTHRADDRFAFCSTFKALAAAAVLDRNPLSHLDKVVTYSEADVDSISPITKDHVATGMTIRQLCDAAVRYSDGTAGNLLMRDIGGTRRLTAYLRGLGDAVSRMDQFEPELNDNRPGDPRDTTTPRAVARDYQELVIGKALPARKRALLKDWLERSTTGAKRIRAGLPKGWTLAHKTGTGNYGRANDIAVVWPPNAAPIVLAIMSDRSGYDAEPREALIAEAAEYVTSALA
ncbi:class A beta-lactamase [Streptomyces sp. NPDC021622]|uniref:class A beta-lactamase n=1 Tax=Streptomyces sp. NPDC021622 TaxID=3155013 RepID=UPI00340427C0